MPGLDPRALKKMMKQIGMDVQEVPASEVIIKKPDGGSLVIKNPQVQKMKIPGQGESYQVVGTASESSGIPEISEEDVNLVSEQAKVSKEEAKTALEANNGDIAKSILSLKNK